MKIRNGFVTNSSSSSFVIAKKDECTKKNLCEHLLKDLTGELCEYFKDLEEMRSYREDEYSDIKSEEDLAERLADGILDMFGHYGCLQLSEWEATCGEASSEDCDLLSNFLYNYGYKLGNDNLKYTIN